jgi:hypothetical protein
MLYGIAKTNNLQNFRICFNTTRPIYLIVSLQKLAFILRDSFAQKQLSNSQVQAFADTLVKKGIIDKSDIEVNKDLIEESLKLSTSTGLQVQLYSGGPVGNTNISVRTAGTSNYNGQPLYRTEWQPTKIFEMLYTSRKNELTT